MRKQTKLVAVLSAAALVALGASMTSMASGWVQQDGMWYYEDANGDYVTGEWKRSGDNYFYLGWDGYMLTNQLIEHGDNYYYVDANGAMVKNQWIAVAADDTEDQDVDHRWYYFGSTGRAYRSSQGFSKKTINGQKYAFDEEGKMLFGWVDEGGMELNMDDNAPLDATYFFGPNDTTTINGVTYTGGAMVTGWYNYLDGIDIYDNEGDDSLWFYFNTSTGKKTVDDEKRIGGLYYHFDVNGVMDSGWTIASGSDATESKYYSGSEQGWKQRNTWVYAVPSEELAAITGSSDNADDTSRWFYVGSNGQPTMDQARRINSKWYVFDAAGVMKTGLVVLEDKKTNDPSEKISTDAHIVRTISTDDYSGDMIKDDLDGEAIYYFSSTEDDGSMKTGTNIRIDLNDGTYTFGFAKNGKAFNGTYQKKIYDNGILLDGGDMRYQAVVHPVTNNYYVVGPTGTYASNNTTVKDADDNYYALVDNGVYMFSSDDYAARAARAWITIKKAEVAGTTDKLSKNTYKLEGNVWQLKVGTDEWIDLTPEFIGDNGVVLDKNATVLD